MKVRLLLAALCAAVGALLLVLPASAAPTGSDAGTIKVKSSGDALYPPENDPQITGCPAAFDVYAYHFAHASVHWNITDKSTGKWMTGGTAELTADSPQPPEGPRYSGYLTQNMKLPDGHYEVDASEVGDNSAKQKVFWVKSSCASSGGGGGGNGGGTGNGGGGGGAGAGQGSSPGSSQGSAPQGGVLAATASLNGSAAQGAVLAQTGLPLGGALFGVFLIVSGLVLRRRR